MLFAQWFAEGFSAPDHGDYEEFANLTAVKDELWRRSEDSHFMHAGVEAGAEFLVWDHDPRAASDPYPTWRVYFGARGGIRHERV